MEKGKKLWKILGEGKKENSRLLAQSEGFPQGVYNLVLNGY